MRFKQNWGMIWQIRLGVCVISLFAIPLCVYFLRNQEWRLAVVLLLCELVVVGCSMLAARTIPGGLTNEISIDGRGISLYENGSETRFFPWEETAAKKRIRRYGTNALAVTNRNGEEIWFFTNRKIERYMDMCKEESEITQNVKGDDQ